MNYGKRRTSFACRHRLYIFRHICRRARVIGDYVYSSRQCDLLADPRRVALKPAKSLTDGLVTLRGEEELATAHAATDLGCSAEELLRGVLPSHTSRA